MTDSASLLNAVESLLNEFFAPHCSNERKRLIEDQLNEFSRQRNACQLCITFLQQSRNPYVLMYSINLIEGAIQTSWLRTMSDEKARVRKGVSELLMHSVAVSDSASQSAVSAHLPSFILNKLCKLMAIIGRFDWPHFYPDFFNNIFQLMGNQQTRLLGCMLLKAASEEFISSKDDLCASRKKELRHLMGKIAPQMFASITGVLESCLASSYASHASAPSSALPPAHLQSCAGAGDGTSVSIGRWTVKPDLPLRSDVREVSLVSLVTLEHIVSWASVDANLAPSLLNILFAYAILGCGKGTEINCEVAVAAVSVVNELLYKNCFPVKDVHACLTVILQSISRLLEFVTIGGDILWQQKREIKGTLVCKLTELVHLLLENHLGRFSEDWCEESVLHFLHVSHAFTFGIISPAQYQASLEPWLAFLEQKTHLKGLKFKSLLTKILCMVLDRLMVCQHSELSELGPFEDSCTEWDNYLVKSVQVITAISEIVLIEACELVLPQWDTFVHRLENGNCSSRCLLRDMATLGRIVGCLASSLACVTNNDISYMASLPWKLADQLICVVRRSEGILQNFQIQSSNDKVLAQTLAQVECECLASVQSFVLALRQHVCSNNVDMSERLVTAVAELALEDCNDHFKSIGFGLLTRVTRIIRVFRTVE